MRGSTVNVLETTHACLPANGISRFESAEGRIEISVVLPVFKSGPCLHELHRRLTETLGEITSAYEIILVDDGSPDDSWQIISTLASADRRIRGIQLSRNFGQHAAIRAGLAHCRGKWSVVLDADLEDPPENIARLYRKALEGHDLVLARRVERPHSHMRKLLAKAYFAVLNACSNSSFDGRCGTLSLMSRNVVDSYLLLSDTHGQHLAILSWLGFQAQFIDYRQERRPHGESAYNFAKLIEHAKQGFFFHSPRLLEFIMLLGVLMALGSVAFSIIMMVWHFLFSIQMPIGYLSLAMMLLFIGGCNLAALGFVGMYVGQVFEQAKGRPLYVVARRLNEP